MDIVKSLTCAKGLGTLERPLYAPGLLLEDDDLTSGVRYTRRLTQLLFSSLFGCGVICGLRVRGRLQCEGRELKVTVERGIGLDCFGNPIEVPSTVELVYDPGCDPFPKKVWVVACYVDRECAPRELACGCDGGNDRAMTRQRAGFEIRLYPSQPGCACSCVKPEPRPERDPDCRCPPDSDKPAAAAAAEPQAASAERKDKPREPEGPVDPDSCYYDHVEGVCECGCGCTCIVLGVVSTTPGADAKPEDDLPLDDAPVRRVRPVPIGLLHERTWPKAKS